MSVRRLLMSRKVRGRAGNWQSRPGRGCYKLVQGAVALRPTKADTVLLRCSKELVATVGRSVAAGGHNTKMIGSASAQPGDVGIGILIGVPAKALIGCGRTITGSSAVLEVNACGQAMGINCSIECG